MPGASNPDPLQALGRRVREVRLARGLSQERLAEESGLHRTYIGGIERGERNPSYVNVLKLAAGLGVDPGDLLSGLFLPRPGGR